MTSRAKAKGDEAERAVVSLLSDLWGPGIERRLGLGRAEDGGDIDGLDCCIQVKSYVDVARAVNEALDALPRQRAVHGGQWGAGFIRRRGGRYFVVMEPETFVSLLREATA